MSIKYATSQWILKCGASCGSLRSMLSSSYPKKIIKVINKIKEIHTNACLANYLYTSLMENYEHCFHLPTETRHNLEHDVPQFDVDDEFDTSND